MQCCPGAAVQRLPNMLYCALVVCAVVNIKVYMVESPLLRLCSHNLPVFWTFLLLPQMQPGNDVDTVHTMLAIAVLKHGLLPVVYTHPSMHCDDNFKLP